MRLTRDARWVGLGLLTRVGSFAQVEPLKSAADFEECRGARIGLWR